MTDNLTLELVITVTYAPNGVPKSQLEGYLYNLALTAANEGLLTQHSQAEVEEWNCEVHESKGGKA